MIITNEKDRFSKMQSQNQSSDKASRGSQWKCENGYNPLNLDISDINMIYCTNIKDLTFQDDTTYRHRVLRDLNIQILIMMKD